MTSGAAQPAMSEQPGPAYDPAAGIRAELDKALAKGTIHGAAFKVFDADGRELFAHEIGTTTCSRTGPDGKQRKENCEFLGDSPIQLASATKWISSTMILGAMDDLGATHLSPDTPIGNHLASCLSNPSTRQKAMLNEVRMRHLLSFTAGLKPEDSCVGDPSMNLRECACKILRVTGNSYTTAGSRYVYGSTYHTVAGAMVEAALARAGRKRSDGQPMSIQDALVRYVNQKLGVNWAYGFNPAHPNPNLAGSIVASLDEYARLVKDVFDVNFKGQGKIMSPASAILQRSDAFSTQTQIVASPWMNDGYYYLPHHYGFNVWRQCYVQPYMPNLKTPAKAADLGLEGFADVDPSCAGEYTFGHAGKHGFTPWIDANRRIFAILALFEPEGGQEGEDPNGTDYRGVGRTLSLAVTPHVNALVNRAPERPAQLPSFRIANNVLWADSFSVLDPDRDSIASAVCEGDCPNGLSVSVRPRVRGKAGQEITLGWIPGKAGTYSFSVRLTDRSLAPKSVVVPVSIDVTPSTASNPN